jgi:GGDEF domain-containing protein
MPAEVKSVLAELIDTNAGDTAIVGRLIAAEFGVELTEHQAATLEEVRERLSSTLKSLKTARAAFEA